MIVESQVGGTLKFRIGGMEIELSAKESVDLSFTFTEKELKECSAIRTLLSKGYLKQINRTRNVELLAGPPRMNGIRVAYGEEHPYLKFAILRVITRRVSYEQYQRTDFSTRKSLVRMSSDVDFLEKVGREETNERIRAEASKRLSDCRS